MIVYCENEQQAALALRYIEADYKKAPYGYINLKRYGVHGENVSTWIDIKNGDVVGVYLLYFDCLHVIIWEHDYPVEQVIEMVQKLRPRDIFAPQEMGERLVGPLSVGFKAEKTYIVGPPTYAEKSTRVSTASRNDLEEIAALIINDENYTNTYQKERLIEQLQKRYDDHFSRFFVIRDGNEIVATDSSYGEIEHFAVMGGLVVSPSHRRMGLAAEIWRHGRAIMLEENFFAVAIVNATNSGSIAFHKKMGSFPLSIQYKFVQRNS